MKKIGLFFLISFFAFLYSAQAEERPLVYSIQIEDYIINPVVSEYITSAIRKSETDKAECLLIQLDTPGGLLTTTRQIVKEIMNANVPIVVYVSPSGARAGSAGVFITMASHIAVMAPSTNIGAAHPVDLGEGPKKKDNIDFLKDLLPKKEEKKEGDKKEEAKKETIAEHSPMADKILNDTVAWVKGIVKERGRNEEWAVNSVEKSISSDEKEALSKGVIDYICEDVQQVLRDIDGKQVTLPKETVTLSTQNATVKKIPLTKRQSILNVLSNPNIAYILMLLGFYGLLYEITHPGFGVPGVAGLICLIVAFYSLQTLPINYAGLLLIILAIILFVAEAFVASYGLLTLGGIVAMFLGSLMLIDSPAYFMRVSISYILPVVLATAGITVFLVTAVVRAHRKKVTTGIEGLVGEEGEADSDIDPEGKVFVHGELWDAHSSEKIKKGEKVRVKEVHGMKVTVERL